MDEKQNDIPSEEQNESQEFAMENTEQRQEVGHCKEDC